MKKVLLFPLFIVLVGIFTACGETRSTEANAAPKNGKLNEKELRKMADTDIKNYYFDNVKYVKTECNPDEQYGEVVYEASYTGKHLSFDGEVGWLYFYDEETSAWKKELVYYSDFQWDIEGLLIDTDKNNFVVNVREVDPDNGTVSIAAKKTCSIDVKDHNIYETSWDKADFSVDIPDDDYPPEYEYRDNMFEDEKANQYDPPVLSFKCDIGKMSVIMHFFSEYVFYEMADESGKCYGEMKPPMMPEDEYDELPMQDKVNQASIVQGDGLILCKKTEADFSSSKDYYAIYDNNAEKWLMDYTECDGLREDPYFMYCGSNMFSYGDSASYLLSPNHKGPIKTDINPNTSGLSMWGYNGYWFYGGHTIVDAYVDGKDKFCVLEDTGKLTPLDFPKTKQRLIGRYCCDEDCFVFYTRNSINDPVEEMVIYEYSTGKFTIIKDTDYTHQLDIKRYSSQITFEDDKISYDFRGVDGNEYHSVFDKNGELITPAEQID